MIQTLELSIEGGKPVLIENLQNTIDAVIQPVYARAIIKKGKSRYIKMGDKELSLHKDFRFYLHTKLGNPHYPPEIQAECALINFTVTEAGLEDQLLTLVVKKERPDLAAQQEELIQQQNQFKITLATLEADLLQRLNDQKGDILEDIELIENLEKSKATATEINEKVEIAKVTEVQIKEASEVYRPAANRGALVFFLLNELNKVHEFYKFSLGSFIIVINRAIDIVAEQMNPKKEKEEGEEEEEGAKEEEEEELELSPRTLALRVQNLIESITFESFTYARRGTFEVHKLILVTMLCLRVNLRKGLIQESEMNALIKKNVVIDGAPDMKDSLKQFIPEQQWGSVVGLQQVKIFENLVSQLESEALQWRKWCGEEKAEVSELPKSQKDLSLFHRLLLLRALRPDRVSNALTQYVKESMGDRYIEQPAFDPFVMYSEMTVQTPAFFVLFPGVDPTPDVEKIGEAQNKRLVDGTFINISMGEGQEDIALKALADSAKTGKWLMVQNVHLMEDWLKVFERALEVACEDDPHPEFRCFISSEPPSVGRLTELIPESILQNSIKVANEAPQDLKSNLRRAMSKFDEAYYQKAPKNKYNEFKCLIFGLCMFHSLILGRRKFGSMGWSKIYNFNDGDLRICGDVLHNYLAAYEKVPYDDLKYLYGEIMYGGHITDDWDRRTNNTYLEVLLQPAIMQQMQLTLHPGFKSPDPAKFEREQYVNYIEEKLPIEQPQMFGLHPNAEIGYLTNQGDTLFSVILSVTGGGGGGGGSAEDAVKETIQQFLSVLPGDFNLIEINLRIEESTPYLIVSMQECERMNILLSTIRKGLSDLQAGLEGALNMTDAMEATAAALRINKVPAEWADAAYFSKKTLQEWFADLLLRVQQLVEWTDDLETPAVLWIAGLFNPMSFLTAIMQVTSRAHQLPLDDICLKTEVRNSYSKEDFKTAETGAYVNGFFLEGAAWEVARGDEQGYLVEMQPKVLHPELPVMHVTAIRRSDKVTEGIYECPVYVTSARGPTFVFAAGLQMESEDVPVSRWILAGVALLMSPE